MMPTRLLMTVLALALAATTAGAQDYWPTSQLVITSASVDRENNRLVIRGLNFSWPANGKSITPPYVTLDSSRSRSSPPMRRSSWCICPEHFLPERTC